MGIIALEITSQVTTKLTPNVADKSLVVVIDYYFAQFCFTKSAQIPDWNQ